MSTNLRAPLAERVATHLGEHYMPFLDAHMVYALARAGRRAAVAASLGEVAARAAATDAEAARNWASVGQPLIAACAAFAQGDAARSAALLDPVMADETVVGGSDAQVDLCRQTYFHSLVQCGRRWDARAYWNTVVDARPRTELDHYRYDLAV